MRVLVAGYHLPSLPVMAVVMKSVVNSEISPLHSITSESVHKRKFIPGREQSKFYIFVLVASERDGRMCARRVGNDVAQERTNRQTNS